jgi:glucose/arabinose dehydrogenase
LTIAKRRNLARGSIFVQILLPVIAAIVIVAAADLVATNYVSPNQDPQFPVMTKNTNFRIELVVSNLSLPTSMAFLDYHNILAVEKNTGYVRLISDNKLRTEPLLKLNVSSQGERGLLGLAILNKSNSNGNSISQITSKSIDSEKDIKIKYKFSSY